MERTESVKMLGIFLTLLVGFAVAEPQYVQQYTMEYHQKTTVYRNPPLYSTDEAQRAHKFPNYGGQEAVTTARPQTQTLTTGINGLLTTLLGTPKQDYPQARAPPRPVPDADSGPIFTDNDAFNTGRDAKVVPAVVNTNAANVPTFATSPASASSHNTFNANLFQVIANSMPQSNIVYSPFSLQLLLAFVYMGASGRTAQQLQSALSLPVHRLETAKMFSYLLATNSNDAAAHLVIANKMYHNSKLTVEPYIPQNAPFFASEIAAIDFDRTRQAAATINAWVAQKTQNVIHQLLTPEQLDAQTQAILVSAIHFKAKWENEFSTQDTEQQKFYVKPHEPVNVSMMYNDDMYRYGEFPELDATGLEMPYQKSNISMLVLLPNKKEGLPAMERRLHDMDLGNLTARMQMESVQLWMPKFTVDFELDMRESLGRLGITDLFTDRADLHDFFRTQSIAVSQMQHKAFLDVNEAGSEAAAASFIKLIPLSLPSRIINFKVDHPFMFAIRSPEIVYFIGHVVNIRS